VAASFALSMSAESVSTCSLRHVVMSGGPSNMCSFAACLSQERSDLNGPRRWHVHSSLLAGGLATRRLCSQLRRNCQPGGPRADAGEADQPRAENRDPNFDVSDPTEAGASPQSQ
jgi:hypothetical protein